MDVKFGPSACVCSLCLVLCLLVLFVFGESFLSLSCIGVVFVCVCVLCVVFVSCVLCVVSCVLCLVSCRGVWVVFQRPTKVYTLLLSVSCWEALPLSLFSEAFSLCSHVRVVS